MPRRKTKPRRQYCGRQHKVIFPTELDIKIELAGHAKFDTEEQRWYKCPFGNHFHLTSQDQKTEVA